MKMGLTVLFGIMCCVGSDACNDAVLTDQKSLQGNWTVNSAEDNGKKLELLVGATLAFLGDKVTIKVKEDSREAVVKLDASKDPKHIDFIPTGKDSRSGITRGIYRLEGNQLTLCISANKVSEPKESGEAAVIEGKRPTKFESKQGALLTLKRNKK